MAFGVGQGMLDVIGIHENKRGRCLRGGDEVRVVGEVGVRGVGEEEQYEPQKQWYPLPLVGRVRDGVAEGA